MSIYDLLMLAVMVGAILFGLWKGLAWQVASLAAIFVSYFVSLNFSHTLAPYISVEAPWNRFAAMLILFLGTSLVVWMFYGYIKSTIRRFRLRGFDAQAGGLVGAFKGVCLCMLITLFAVSVFGSNVRNSVVTSRSGGYIAGAINRINMMVPDEIHAVLDKHVQSFNQNLENQQPGFVQNSQQKLDEKLQIIHGTLKLPQSNPSRQLDSRFTTSNSDGGNFAGGQAEQGGGQNFQPPNVRTIADDVFDATKEASKNFLNEKFNR